MDYIYVSIYDICYMLDSLYGNQFSEKPNLHNICWVFVTCETVVFHIPIIYFILQMTHISIPHICFAHMICNTKYSDNYVTEKQMEINIMFDVTHKKKLTCPGSWKNLRRDLDNRYNYALKDYFHTMNTYNKKNFADIIKTI